MFNLARAEFSKRCTAPSHGLGILTSCEQHRDRDPTAGIVPYDCWHTLRVPPCVLINLSAQLEYLATTERNSFVLLLAGTTCGHLDETIFIDELMTGFVDSVRGRHWLARYSPSIFPHTYQ